ncbi:MAG TPA: ATP-binding protein [Polyangiaceae bacterium]|jgi:signal transduction histidine kinase
MVVSDDVIVLWVPDEGRETFPWWTRTPAGVRLIAVAPDALARAIPAAAARGPVVAVVGGDHQAHRALALGADEVVRAGEATVASLSSAVERARLRGIGRESRERPPAEASGVELLAATVVCRLASPLALASVNLGVLEPALGAIARLADAYASSAATGRDLVPTSEMQRIVALRASAPATSALNATVRDLAVALREASSAVAHVHALVGTQDDEETDLTVTITQFAQLVRPVVERVADLHLDVPVVGVRVSVGRSLLVEAFSTLLTESIRSLSERTHPGAITMRAEPRVSAALVEIVDNGSGMSAVALADATEPIAGRRRDGARSGLAKLAERLRRAGGELLLESEPGVGTTARIFVPMVLSEPAPDSASN